MQAVVLEQPRQFALHEIDEPAAPGPGEALVRVHRVGICGTDISGYLGKFPFYSYPRIPGHELGVEVVAVGDGVTNVQAGDRCAVEPYINNPESFASRRGRPNCCNDLQVLGVHTDGGMRPYFIVPARKLHISASLPMEQLALVETLAIGCHAVDRSVAEPGEFLMVIGAGPIGLSVVEFAKLAGVELIVMDTNARRLEFCTTQMGVKHTVEYRDDESALAELRTITGGYRPTIVIDATGNKHSMQNAFRFVEHTGKLVYVGIVTDEIAFRHPQLHAPEITLLASRNALPRDFARIIKLIEDKQIDTKPWITHRTNPQEVVDGFEDLIRPENGVIKAIVEIP
ncbi:MAG: zinc-binding alcohol dehydrogenase family protein [Planctomycetales bacterium]|nr:zinc-binding alcohol dehydrogenase family protein [Planctomycetales bacterium]